MPYYLYAAAFNIVTYYASDADYLQLSECLIAVNDAPAALKTVFAYLIILTCILLSVLSLFYYSPLYECLSGFMH